MRRGLRLCFAATIVAPGAAMGQAEETLQPVVVVGSRLPRLDAETALPVQVIGRKEIERSGATNAEELLDRISANFGGFREALGINENTSPGLAGASLRGFGAGETLVLLNGRRIANFAFSGTGGAGVDLHAIPLAAIERVEVLKDGASALYGSDAVAGVINFVTRTSFIGSNVAASQRFVEAGGGARSRGTLSFGAGQLDVDGYNGFVVLDAQRAEHLRARDRGFADTAYRPDIGLDVTSPSSFPANVRRRVGGVPAPFNPAAPACTPQTVNKGSACWFDYATTADILPPSQQASLLARGTMRLAGGSEAYAEVLGAWDRIRFESAPSPANPSFTASGTTFLLPPSSPYYVTAPGLAGPLSLLYRTVPLGNRTSDVRSDQLRLLVGAKTRAAGWDLDGAVSANTARSRERYVSGYVDAAQLSEVIGTGLVNPFGPSTPEGDELLRSAELRGPSRGARGRLLSADVHANRELLALPGGPLAVATGVEFRRETLRDVQYPIAENIVGGVAAAEKEGSRNVAAGYAEVVAPVARGVEIQAAVRADRYSDFGTSVNPKLALRLQPDKTWLVRASAGTGFRAPSLPELYTQQRSSFFEIGLIGGSDPVRCPVTGLESDCFPAVPLVDGGNPKLKPQHSTQWSTGLVVEPSTAWFASVDVWSIRIKDVIRALDPFDVIADLARYDNGRNVVRGPVDPAYPGLPGPIVRIETLNENLGDWRVRGLDLSLALKPRPTPLGLVSARFDGTYVQQARQNIFAGAEVDLIGGVVPRWQHVASLTLEQGAWSANLAERFRRGYRDVLPLPDGSTRRVASYRLVDLGVQLALTPQVRLSLGVRNLFDRDPPASNQPYAFQVGYSPLYADPLGRNYQLGLQASWR